MAALALTAAVAAAAPQLSTTQWAALGGGAWTVLLLLLLRLQQRSVPLARPAESGHHGVSLDMLSLVARRTSNAVVITNAQRRITWVNASFERITGYAAEEVRDRHPGELLQCEATDELSIARMRDALNHGFGFAGQLVNQGKNGRRYWIEIEIQPLRDDSGQISGYMALQTDISERRAAEAALRASQTFLDKAGRIGGVGGWSIDLATRDVQWSDQSCRILDLEPGHKPTLAECLQYCAPEGRPRIELALARGLEDGSSWDMELPFITARGRAIWVRVAAEAEFADSGPVRLVGALQDISAQRALQADTERNASLLRGAIDTIDEAFVLYDPDDRLVLCNDKYKQLYALSADLMQPGNSFEHIIRVGAERGQYPAAIGRVDEWVAQRMVKHRAGNSTLVQRLDSGRVLRIIERKMPDGHTVGFRIDITDLVRATEAAESADRAKTEFIATISHELRTPLQAIIGFSSLGRHFAADQPQFLQMYQDIHAGGQRMLTLVNGLLDISKVDTSLETLHLRSCDLMELADEVVRELRPLAAERHLQIDLPDQTDPLPALVDGFRISQVLRNLLANAIRFAPPHTHIRIDGCRLSPDQVQLTVSDSGPGIPEAELESIFQPFVQSTRTKDGSGGSGLGLTICRKIVEAHGGRIRADNVPAAEGSGAQMTVLLPVSAAPPQLPASHPPEASPAPPERAARPARLHRPQPSEVNP